SLPARTDGGEAPQHRRRAALLREGADDQSSAARRAGESARARFGDHSARAADDVFVRAQPRVDVVPGNAAGIRRVDSATAAATGSAVATGRAAEHHHAERADHESGDAGAASDAEAVIAA